MKNIRLIISVIILTLLFQSCENDKKPSNERNKKNIQKEENKGPHLLKENGFYLTLPNKPKVDVRIFDTDFGERQVFYYSVRTKNEKIHLIYSDYPPLMLEIGTKEEVLKGVLESLLFETRAEVINEEDFLLDSLNGVQILAESPDVKVAMRLLFVESRLYQLLYMTDLGWESARYEEIFKSFGLVKNN